MDDTYLFIGPEKNIETIYYDLPRPIHTHRVHYLNKQQYRRDIRSVNQRPDLLLQAPSSTGELSLSRVIIR